MTAVVFSDQRKIGQYYYTRLEYHRMVQTKGGMACQITNQVFRGMTQNELGQPASFDSVDAWADIEPEAIITGIEKPLFGYFRYPVANNIDTTSPLGISCFARAQDATNLRLIRDADEIYSQLVWEFESGKRAIYVEPEAFEKGDDNKPKLPDRRLYRTLSSTADIGEKGKLFTAWSPDFREASIKSGLDAILKKIEFNCGLAYGIISDPQSVALTATEIKASKQAYYATITNTQKALKVTLDNLIYAMDVWATLAGAAPVGSYTVTYQWDDSIVADHDTQFAQDQQTMTANKMPGYIFLMRNYGLDEATAKKWVAEADAEKQPFSFFPADQNQDMAQ
jgi:A118 family predicted phage portal protein